MTIHELRKVVDKLDDSLPDYDDKRVTVLLSQPSFPSRASTDVVGIGRGIDWDGWQVMIKTKDRIIKKTNQ